MGFIWVLFFGMLMGAVIGYSLAVIKNIEHENTYYYDDGPVERKPFKRVNGEDDW